MRWTGDKLAYLEEHAHEGEQALAEHFGVSIAAVRSIAKKYGVSLRVRYWCINCCKWTYIPLNPKTGWCSECTKKLRMEELEREVEDLRKERERQRRLDARLKSLRTERARLRRELGE